MLRGTKKQIIHLKHTESPLFEEAFFIVKHSPPADMSSPRTLAEEANRLLSEPDKSERPASPPPRVRGVRRAILIFLLGAACGAAILTLCFLL